MSVPLSVLPWSMQEHCEAENDSLDNLACSDKPHAGKT